ncbi:MAG TPA: hypothetical protein VFX60_09710 [Micromonospora sp.]|nr:hypothetical protein [Micromonospora sp.]
MNQVLVIDNAGHRSVAPTLEFTALDSYGEALSDVWVTTVFGSDLGDLVVPPGESADVLVFEGAGSDRVEDVRVFVKDAAVVDFPLIRSDVEVEPLDAEGRPVTRNDRFTSVALHNDNPDPVAVRLVYIIWTDPPPSRTQQAERVLPVGDLIVVPARGTVTVPMEGEADLANAMAAGRVAASIKAYFSR